ncbi:hypothetical protein [Williamsia sp. 1135]|uniref:hypothetical protein n=1 Tax=Williamsia sp. 1135 TaxID=1889262 RepID=UPI000A118288|nr:hypothetical protein [Williamsia sp. 1135]ORM37801.1 hypothetical protein BFL43_03090 [Williamsia sp. 1135]
MTDEYDAVAVARAKAVECQQIADAEKDRCLAGVADGLRDRIDELGKRVAKDQPDVATALGKAGIDELRADLADVATAMAADLLGARDRVIWSDRNGEPIHSSLFTYLYKGRMEPISAALRAHGFEVSGQFAPQDLYRTRKDEQLSLALARLESAQYALNEAIEAQKKQSVDDLWD